MLHIITLLLHCFISSQSQHTYYCTVNCVKSERLFHDL